MPQQELECHRRWELRCATEPAAQLIEVSPKRSCSSIELIRGHGRIAPHRRCDPFGKLAYDVRPGGLDLLAPLDPGARHRLADGAERRYARPVGRWEVSAAEERLPRRRQETCHRPPTVTGHRLRRLHVDGVDVRSFLPVDLHRHEVFVDVGGSGRILERLVRHDVAPVTRGVTDRQQHRHASA